MRLSVIGAGAMGSAIAMCLAERDDVDRVQICDANARALHRVSRLIENDKLRSFQIDARDVESLAPVIRGSECVVAAVGQEQLPALARLALDSGSHYCDLGTSDEGVERLLSFSDEAKTKGTWIVPGNGLSPGLVNVLAMRGIEQFDEVSGAYIRIGSLPKIPRPPFEFNLTWSAQRLLDDYTLPVRVIDGGEVRICHPLTQDETIEFEPPFGRLEAFCTAGGLLCLPDELSGRLQSLNLKTLRWPGHADRIRFLLGLGFAESRSVDVRTHLTYRDLLLRRMKQKLTEPQEGVLLMRIVIHGQVRGKDRTLRYEMIEADDPAASLNAMRRCTAIPTTIVACQLASGSVDGGGAGTPEFVIPRTAFLVELRENGLDVRETWTDGLISVQDPS